MTRYGLLFLFLPACLAQDYRSNDLSAGFRYDVKLGQNSYYLGNSFGYAVKYSYRPRRWLALEAGMEQIVHPIGGSVCCRYVSSADDNLFLVPFGARYVWEPEGGRIRLSVGGGGAYLNHTIGNPECCFSNGASGWGAQAVASGDYALTRSGRFRAGLTARYYYVPVNLYVNARLLTLGPDFTFSFR